MCKVNVIYSASARSFTSKKPIQKMRGVISGIEQCGAQVLFIGGGDLYPRQQNSASMGGNSPGHSLKNRGWLKETISETLDIAHDFVYFFYLLPVFIRNSNAIVLERSSRLHISAVLLAKLFQRKLLLEWKDHLIDYESSLFKRLALFIEDIKIKFADCIIVESYVLQQLLIKRYPNKQFHVAYNAVELGHLNGEHLTVVRDRDIGFLYAGGYADYHDMLSLVDAAVLLAHRNLSFNFVCIGNGPHRAEMESKVIALGLQNYFTFVNSVSYDSLTEFYKRSVFGILPGCTEIICPIKVFEYMGFGLIPVIPDYLCNREVLSDDVAFYFEPINPRSIADTIEKCLSLLQNNGEYLDALSLENFRQAKEKFNWVATWGELIALKSLGIEYEFKKY